MIPMETKVIELLRGRDWEHLKILIRSRPSEAVAPLMKALLEEPPFDSESVRIGLGEIRSGGEMRAHNMVLESLIEETGEHALHPLVAALQDSRWWVFETAALALSKLGPTAGLAFPSFLEALQNPHRRLRALDALRALGPAAKDGSKEIGIFLGDKDEITRSYAVRSLAAIGSSQALALIEAAIPLETDSEIRAQMSAALRHTK